jgi:ATP-dependent DNA ligase
MLRFCLSPPEQENCWKQSFYPAGRSNDWVQKTCAQGETLTIAGFALDGNKWDGLYVGRRKGDELVYAGKVDHGFDKVSTADLKKRLTPLVRKTQAFAKRVAHKGIWVEPKLLAEIEYRAKSAEGRSGTRFSADCEKTCDGCDDRCWIRGLWSALRVAIVRAS